MVRFIINKENNKMVYIVAFTFQYGQIYYDKERAEELKNKSNLHSNMVRFIIAVQRRAADLQAAFTFQYGQIYYVILSIDELLRNCIYIPIWLDLLFFIFLLIYIICQDLHSNMVRFIIYYRSEDYSLICLFTFQYGQIYYTNISSLLNNINSIYIPIWLDLLLGLPGYYKKKLKDLHSNMVRFIMFITSE